MKQKEIIEKLKEGYYIERKTIGYQSDNIFLYKEKTKPYIQKITNKQLESLINKISLNKSQTETTLNGIGGRITDVITITYKLL